MKTKTIVFATLSIASLALWGCLQKSTTNQWNEPSPAPQASGQVQPTTSWSAQTGDALEANQTSWDVEEVELSWEAQTTGIQAEVAPEEQEVVENVLNEVLGE